MVQAATKIEAIVAPVVNALGFDLYACVLRANGRSSVLQVLVEGPNGLTLDDCASISRQLCTTLDVVDPIAGRYTLEVSSPGMDRPLLHETHYQRALAKTAKIKTRRAIADKRTFIGKIIKVADGKVTLALDEGEMEVTITDIDKARLIIEV